MYLMKLWKLPLLSILSLMFLITASSPTFAASEGQIHFSTNSDDVNETNLQLLTRDEYIEQRAEVEGISYSEMEEILNNEEASRPAPLANYVRHYGRFCVYWNASTYSICSSSNTNAIEGGCFITYYADANNWSLRYVESADTPYIMARGSNVTEFTPGTTLAYKTGTLSVRYVGNYTCKIQYGALERNKVMNYDFYI